MKILIIAGEASGDLHGSYLAKSLIDKKSSIELYGVGGVRMKSAGVTLYYDIEETGIVGAVEILGKIFFFKKLYTFLVQKINEEGFDAVILIDYPTLNLRLAHVAKKREIPVYYYISPQIWAWRSGRVEQIKRDVTRMITILPFEQEFYRKKGMDVDFPGHPFVDIVKPSMNKQDAVRQFGGGQDIMIIGLFPGSRNNELDALLPIMLRAASLIRGKNKKVQFLLPVAETIDKKRVEKMIADSYLNVTIVEGANYDVMNISDFLIVASGSVTLEASFFAVPMVIIYRVNFLTYLLGKMLVKISNIGLVNIVGGETIIPELIQYDATPEKIAAEALAIMDDPDRYKKIVEKLKAVSRSLGKEGVCDRVADIILSDYA